MSKFALGEIVFLVDIDNEFALAVGLRRGMEVEILSGPVCREGEPSYQVDVGMPQHTWFAAEIALRKKRPPSPALEWFESWYDKDNLTNPDEVREHAVDLN